MQDYQHVNNGKNKSSLIGEIAMSNHNPKDKAKEETVDRTVRIDSTIISLPERKGSQKSRGKSLVV